MNHDTPEIKFIPGAQTQVKFVPVPGLRGPQGDPGSGLSSVQIVGTASAAVSGHRAVTRMPDGGIYYISNDDPAHVTKPLWITTGSAALGEQVAGIAFGELVEPSWSWVPGPVFLGASGMLTQSAPTAPGAVFLVQVGTATSATSLFVDRRMPILL